MTNEPKPRKRVEIEIAKKCCDCELQAMDACEEAVCVKNLEKAGSYMSGQLLPGPDCPGPGMYVLVKVEEYEKLLTLAHAIQTVLKLDEGNLDISKLDLKSFPFSDLKNCKLIMQTSIEPKGGK